MNNAKDQTIAVIGAGIAGLASAARLAAKGHTVHLFDKNSQPGGKLGLWQQDGYSFDTGPSLFTQPYVLEQVFKDCGKPLADYFSYEALPVSTHYFWQDGVRLKAYTNHDTLAAEIETQLQVDPKPTLRLLQRCKEAYEAIGTIFLDEPIHQWKTWASPRILRAIAALKIPYITSSMHEYHKQSLNHPHLVQLFDRFATYNGSDAYRAPAMLSMIAHLELNEGAFYPKGGMIAIPKALHRLCVDMGVHCHFDTAVTAINYSGNKVTEIRTSRGDIVRTDIVVAAGDIHHIYSRLLKDIEQTHAIEKEERSDSAFVFYWGVNKSFPNLHLHNIFFSDKDRTENPEDRIPNLYVNITSKMEEGLHAPTGSENWFTMIVTKPGQDNRQLETEYRRKARSLLRQVLGEDIATHVTLEAVLSPKKIEQQTFCYRGALYGTSSNHPMAAFRRHPNRHKKLTNLYFAGGTVHPGGGIPLCLRSARIVSDMITADSKRR